MLTDWVWWENQDFWISLPYDPQPNRVLGGKMPQDQTEPPEAAAVIHRLLAGGWVAQIIHATAELGLADHFGEEAADVATLANATATHPPSAAFSRRHRRCA